MSKRNLILFTALAGCAATDNATIEQGVTCPVPDIDPARSLAVTDPEVLAKFSFERVMTAIHKSGHNTGTVRRIYRDWMNTFGNCDDPEIDPNGYGIRCPRVETQFADFDPFAPTGPRFVPLAIVNRFDLAPTSGADCGEHRIVFGLRDSPLDRGFIIFEARLPNPDPAAGLTGCVGVAEWWAALTNEPSVAKRAAKLERLYFTGITSGGRTYEPVVTASHYGLAAGTPEFGAGQIRTNFFADSREWHLREFKLRKPCAADESCKLSAAHVPVKANPADELFRGTHERAPAFQAAFMTQIKSLSRSAARIGLSTSNDHNEFESSATIPANLIYRNFTEDTFKAKIAAAIENPNLSADNILDRATTQTCGGCHQASNGKDLGDGVHWPISRGFVHIDESSNLSEALTKVFLPRRATVLENFLEGQCIQVTIPDDGLTLSGGPLDAPN